MHALGQGQPMADWAPGLLGQRWEVGALSSVMMAWGRLDHKTAIPPRH